MEQDNLVEITEDDDFTIIDLNKCKIVSRNKDEFFKSRYTGNILYREYLSYKGTEHMLGSSMTKPPADTHNKEKCYWYWMAYYPNRYVESVTLDNVIGVREVWFVERGFDCPDPKTDFPQKLIKIPACIEYVVARCCVFEVPKASKPAEETPAVKNN